MNRALTSNQRAILTTLKRAEEAGYSLDLDELIRRVPYPVTKQAIQFTIRSLIRRELIEKRECRLRQQRVRRVLVLTDQGRASAVIPSE